MQTLTLSIEKKETQTVEIPIPCFMRSKDEKNYIGLLDENTVVTIYDNGGCKILSNTELWLKKTDLATAWFEYHSCTESEFLTKYDEVVESMSLRPELTTANVIDHEAHENLRSQISY